MLHAQEILNLKKRLNEIYVKHTGQPLQKIEEALERDFFMTAETAKDFGLVDKVIDLGRRYHRLQSCPERTCIVVIPLVGGFHHQFVRGVNGSQQSADAS